MIRVMMFARGRPDDVLDVRLNVVQLGGAARVRVERRPVVCDAVERHVVDTVGGEVWRRRRSRIVSEAAAARDRVAAALAVEAVVLRVPGQAVVAAMLPGMFSMLDETLLPEPGRAVVCDVVERDC